MKLFMLVYCGWLLDGVEMVYSLYEIGWRVGAGRADVFNAEARRCMGLK